MSLIESIQKLELWLRSLGEAPNWSDVVIVEKYTPGTENNPSEIPKSELKTIAEYEERFNELMERGYSWLHLSGDGLIKGKLFISVNYPNQSSGCPKERVSINMSGPPLHVIDRWNIERRVKLI